MVPKLERRCGKINVIVGLYSLGFISGMKQINYYKAEYRNMT